MKKLITMVLFFSLGQVLAQATENLDLKIKSKKNASPYKKSNPGLSPPKRTAEFKSHGKQSGGAPSSSAPKGLTQSKTKGDSGNSGDVQTADGVDSLGLIETAVVPVASSIGNLDIIPPEVDFFCTETIGLIG